MQTFGDRFKRYGVAIILALLIGGGIGLFTFWAGTVGSDNLGFPIALSPLPTTNALPIAGTPVARFARLRPEILDYLDYASGYGVIPLDVLGSEIQPVGAYMPMSGNVQLNFTEPTPLPTPLPYPTSPPLPLPAIPNQPIPTIELDENGTPRTLPYAGDSCAPKGNPVDGILTQRFHLYHSGIDIATPLGTPVLATHSGQVIFADWSDVGYGYLVILQNGPFITYYAHNISFNVSVNQFVGRGSIIAWSGSTGNSSGPHVHYETRINDVPVDPLTFDSRGYLAC